MATRRRCAPSSAASATSSTTSKARRSASPTRGPRAQGREDPAVLRREPASRTGCTPKPARPCSRRSIPSSRCGARASTRARRGLRRLPHAVHARGRAQDQRPSRAQPAAEHQPRLPDLPPLARGGDQGARRDDPDRRTSPMRNVPMDALMELDRRHQAAQQGRRRPTRNWQKARDYAAQGAVPARLRQAENSMGFHAPQEAARVLGEAIDFCRQGQLSVRTTVSPAQQAPLQKASLQSAPSQGK